MEGREWGWWRNGSKREVRGDGCDARAVTPAMNPEC